MLFGVKALTAFILTKFPDNQKKKMQMNECTFPSAAAVIALLGVCLPILTVGVIKKEVDGISV